MKIWKIKESSNYCGGFKPPKGHLDTQMYPECEGYETDRNIVKKTVERRKKQQKKKRKKKASIQLESKHGFPVVQTSPRQPKGVWEKWINGEIGDSEFVNLMMQIKATGFSGVSKDPRIRNGIKQALDDFAENKNYSETAKRIGALLSLGKDVREEFFASFNLKNFRESQKKS